MKSKKKLKEPVSKIVSVRVKSLPISPRKLRLVAQAIKTKTPLEAVAILPFINKKGARFLLKAIKSAIANAKHNFHLEEKSLRFREIMVNEGLRLKRFDKSHGARFHRGVKIKRRSHLFITLEGKVKDGAKG